jgi:prevent-host-death family protein
MKRASRQGSEEARRNFPTLVERAARGEPTLITKHGKPYAALVPASAISSRSAGADLRSLRGTGKGLWGRSARRTIARMRDEWR